MNPRFVYSDDTQMVAALLADNEEAIRYVFYDNYTPLLRLNYRKIAAATRACFDDLVQDLYLYLSKDDWNILRRYDPTKSPFANWFSVVSYRFFKDSVRSMIDSSTQVPIDDMDDHNITMASRNIMSTLIMDIKEILRHFRPPRDREVLEAFLIHDEDPDSIATRLGVTVDNLYNIKRRALERLRKNYLSDYKN